MARTVYISFRYVSECNLIWHVQLTVLFVICPNTIWYGTYSLHFLSLHARM